MRFTFDNYLYSSVGKGGACHELGKNLRHGVKTMMTRLDRSGTVGRVAARVISPFVGLGTTAVSIALRIANIVEPIFEIFTDLGAALIFLKPRALLGITLRPYHIYRNLKHQIFGIPEDFVKIGIVASFGGIFTPTSAYNRLSPWEVKWTTNK